MPKAAAIIQDGSAWYRPSTDSVGIPARNGFHSSEEYYSTVFHELTHSTGHKSRQKRFEETSADHQFGSESYSKEELVAEMGAAMLCGFTGIAPQIIGNSAAYLQTWITRLTSDSRLIISAASCRAKAAITSLAKGANANERHVSVSDATGREVPPARDCGFCEPG
jgi:antirestriction protein ArdC